jgi:hypothetical protein
LKGTTDADGEQDDHEARYRKKNLYALGPRYVYLKGGHLVGEDCPDLVYDGEIFVALPAKRVATKNTHGTGCTLSSAIAALLPQSSDAISVKSRAILTPASLIEAFDPVRFSALHEGSRQVQAHSSSAMRNVERITLLSALAPSMMNRRQTFGSSPRSIRLSMSACTTAAFSVALSIRPSGCL